MKLRKFREDLGFGRFTNFVGYAFDASKLPEPLAGTEWREDTTFDERIVTSDDRDFRRVVNAVHRDGYATVKRLV